MSNTHSPDLSPQDLEDLKRAKTLLEKPNVAVRLTNALGYPIERSLSLLPANWSAMVQRATQKALSRALHVAVNTFQDDRREPSATGPHKFAAALSGALSGMVGLPALLIELPISTTIILRSIADIARSQGEDIRSPECQIACLQVFALGGTTSGESAAESGYFAVRAILARGIAEAANFISERGLVEEGAPVIVRLLASIASRFQVAVSEKAMAQAIPLLGAAGGAAINTLFISHFQDLAQGHFTIRRLERTYGPVPVRAAYARLSP